VSSRVGAPSIVNSWIVSNIEPPAAGLRAAIHLPSGDTVARPGTDDISLFATGRAEAVGVPVAAMVGAGVALVADDVVGATEGAGAAHADAKSDTARTTTWFFTTSG
jgi:hypothetical protein